MKNALLLCFLCCATLSYGQRTDSFAVHFALKETTVNTQSAAYINKLISKKSIQPGQKLMLLGYADYRGTAEHNDSVSTERAMNVQDYLVSKGFNKNDITYAGKGKIDRPTMTAKGGYAPDRKVLIIPAATTHLDNNIAVNETVALKNIFFEGGLPDILPASMPELQNLVDFLNTNKTMHIQVEGHVCCKGMSTSNTGPYSNDDDLSKLRAKAVYDYLTAKGIAKNRMKYVGFGTTHPKVYPATTEDEQQSNRRVEIRVLSK